MTNKHDQYFAAQRISLAPRTTGVGLPLRGRRRLSSIRAFAVGVAVGAALSWFAGAHAGSYEAKMCEVEAITSRQLAEARDAGVPEQRAHDRLDRLVASHFELALTAGEIRREHAHIAEIWALRHLTPDTVFGLMLHRCLFGRAQS